MASRDIKKAFLDLSDADLEKLILERDQKRVEREQAKERAGELKATLAHVCDQLMIAGALPEWINVEAVRGKDDKINFYRALKVGKQK